MESKVNAKTSSLLKIVNHLKLTDGVVPQFNCVTPSVNYLSISFIRVNKDFFLVYYCLFSKMTSLSLQWDTSNSPLPPSVLVLYGQR